MFSSSSRKSTPIKIIWLLVLFYMLWSTAEVFFVPALKQLATILKLSPDIAGVTLLALGNGAPDIFAALSAVTSDAGALGLSNLLGGGTLVMTIVISIVLLSFQKFTVKTQRSFFFLSFPHLEISMASQSNFEL